MKKTVLIHTAVANKQDIFSPIIRTCPVDVRQQLSSAGVQTVESSEWVLLYWNQFNSRKDGYRWSTLDVPFTIEGSLGTSRVLNDADRRKLTELVRQPALWFPVAASFDTDLGDHGEFPLQLTLFGDKTAFNSPVYAMLHQGSMSGQGGDDAALFENGRLLAFDRKTLELQWVSQIVWVKQFDLEFKDFDGDQVKDVIVSAEEREGAKGWVYQLMTIFGSGGKELTRSARVCKETVDHMREMDDSTCPLFGEAVQFDFSEEPPAINVIPPYDHYSVYGDPYTIRLRFVNGKYEVHQAPPQYGRP